MIGFETATEVLTNLDWKRMNLNILLSRRESGVSRDVRAWCMYFLLAFLNAPDDVTLVKQFLQNAGKMKMTFLIYSAVMLLIQVKYYVNVSYHIYLALYFYRIAAINFSWPCVGSL